MLSSPENQHHSTADQPQAGPVGARAVRPAVSFARVARLTLLFTTPLVVALSALVVWEGLGIVPAAAALFSVVLVTAFLLRLLVSDWVAVAAYLQPLPVRDSPSERLPSLRFSEGARDVARSARSLRRRALQAIARAESEAAAQARLLDALPAPLLMINSHGIVMQTNAVARQLFGRELENRPLTAVLRDPAVLEAVDRVLDGSAQKRSVQVTLGSTVERTFHVEVQHLDDDIPLAAHALVTLHDITALVRAEQMRADFVANASHELRTPLTSILGFVETLRGPARDDQEAQDRFLAIMYQQASRMRRLIEDLLSLSRIELREHTPPTAAVRLDQVISDVVDGLEILAEDKEMPVEVSIAPDVPDVLGDADELTQVLQNLISNGIKYGKNGTPLEIRAEFVERGPAQMPHAVRSRCVAVHVTDHGDGIAKEHLPRLTERFYRVDTARSRQLGGTGLGLAIVKHIVNRHRGALLIDSTVGHGATFSVYLPVFAEQVPMSRKPENFSGGRSEEI